MLSLPLVLLLLPAVYATHHGTGSGTFTGSNGTPHVRTAGGNMIITHSVIFTIAGASSGTCAGQERDVFHPRGRVTFQGMCTFTGMVGGKSGTAVERYSGTGSMTSFEADLSSSRAQMDWQTCADTGVSKECQPDLIQAWAPIQCNSTSIRNRER